MKTEMKILSLLLVLALLLPCLFACDPEVSESSAPSDASDVSENGSTPEESKPEEPNGAELYKAAREKFEALKNFGITREYTSTAVAGAETVAESGEVEESYVSYGEEGMRSLVKTKYTNGADRTVEFTMIDVDDKSYLTYGDNKFFSENGLSETNFIILDETLYSDITVTVGENDTVIKFANASKVEESVADEYSKLISAEGEAVLDKEGNLVSCSYKTEYKVMGVNNKFEHKLTVTPYDEKTLPEIKAPDDADDYKKITDITAPLWFEDAMYELENLNVFTYSSTSTILVAAAGYGQDSNTKLDYFDYDGKFYGKNKYSMDVYFNGQYQSSSTEQTLADGKYTLSFNGKDAGEQKYNDKQIEGFKGNIFSSIIYCAPELTYAEDFTVSYDNGYVTIRIKGNEEYDKLIRKEICNYVLSGDPEILDNSASSYRTDELEFVITVDTVSNLPVAYNIDYKGYHKIEGREYELSLELVSSFNPGSPDAYYNVTEEHHPDFDEAPEKEEEAKPLFYKVTGANGETLWLLGTIHIGDNRTAYLPKEIYDAFDSADAVAFEIDMKEHERRMEEDDKYIERAYKAMLYTNGRTELKDKISEELNEKTENLLSILGLGAYGEYTSAMSKIFKPVTARTYITATYDAHSLAYDSDKGVDYRLMERADNADKKVYGIEKLGREFDMYNKMSDELMEFMLKMYVEVERVEYVSEAIDMYEKWCKGDYEALYAMVNATVMEGLDKEELTEEDMKLYEEYDNMLTTERDALMLDTIKGYLESEETVFVAVGLAHLLDSETGLVKTLAEAGYTVELVEYAA